MVSDPQPLSRTASAFRSGGGAMGARVRSFDWSATPLGPIERWPAALRVTVDLMLAADFPSCLFWGPELISIYNDGYVPILGDKPDALGRPMRAVWAEVWDDLEPIAAKALCGESTYIEDHPLRIRRHGYDEDTWFTFCYSPVFDERGAVVGMLDTVVETTDRVIAARAAHEERERQQDLLRRMPGFVAMLSGPEHRFTYANDAYRTIAGNRELIGLTVRQAFPELADQGFYGLLERVYTSAQPWQGNAIPIRLTGDAAIRHIDLLYEPIVGDDGLATGIFVSGYDVTDRVRAEAEAKAAADKLRELNADLERRVVERTLARGRAWTVTPELLSVIDAQGRFELVNPAWERTLGWTEAEMSGTRFSLFVHPDDLATSEQAWTDAMDRGLAILRFENRYRTRAGGWRWLSWVAVPEDDKVYCITRDIQPDKDRAAALAEAQEALRQSQKMEAVGQLTGGIAHDFNNLLAAIGASLQLLKTHVEQGRPDDLLRYVEMGERSVRNAAGLTQRLLAFSRRQTLDPRPLDVNRLVAGLSDLIRRSVGPDVRVDVIAGAELGWVRADASQLETALLNLCINARDAMLPDGGLLTIETRGVVVDETAAAGAERLPGEYVELAITDTGVGMTAEVVGRIFEPFFTTKPIGQGTGLGLSMVYGFVRQSGGQVSVDSAPGRGTTVALRLPRFTGPLDGERRAAAAETASPGDGETVLVIEDEETLRDLFTEVLAEAGYRVLQTGTGPDGLRVLQSDARIDLLLTDVGLPGGLNGRQVADAGRLLRPALQVLFVTGYVDNAAVREGMLESGMRVMTKPLQIASLVNTVREMLDGR